MKIPPEDIHAVFQAYDVRGKYPKPLSPRLAYGVGRALAAYLHEAMRVKAGRVAIGRDMRHGSDPLAAAVAAGLKDHGVTPVDLGLVSTDMVYFAAGEYPTIFDGALMITASHNPPHHNGLKFVISEARSIDANTGLNIIRDMMLARNAPVPDELPPLTAERLDVADAYVGKLFSIARGPFAPVKVVVDAGNGMAGRIFPLIAERIPCKVVPLYFTLDGSFPGRGPNPTIPEALAGLQAAVSVEKADLGVAFDADGDRLLTVDELGQPLAGAVLAGIIAQAILGRHGPSTVVFDLTSGRALEECVAKAGGTPMIAPVGHSRIKEWLRRQGGLFGAEESGHYYFRDFYHCDSGMLALLVALGALASAGQPLSALAQASRALYHRAPNENYLLPCRENALACVKRIDGMFPDTEAQRITRFGPDLRKDYEDWWFSIRPSGTEPRVLRLTVEARERPMAEERMAQLRGPVLAWGGEPFVPPSCQMSSPVEGCAR